MHKYLLPAICSIGLALTGCGKSEPVAPPAPAKVNPQPPVQLVVADSAESAPPLDPSANASNTEAPEVALQPETEIRDEPGSISRADALNLLVDDFKSQQGRMPRDLNELVSARLLPRLPVAPAGKRFALNNESRVIVVDK